MKALLLLGFFGIMSGTVTAEEYPQIKKAASEARYEVPVSAELQEYATFDLPDFKKKINGDTFSVEYTLPEMLTGNVEQVELKGKIGVNKDEIFLVGKKGTAKCAGLMSVVKCTISYENLDIDESKAIEAIKLMSTTFEELTGRIEVMRSFSTDPVGIITY